MKTSPFKVMTSAALATALAVPAVATTVNAAEVDVETIAFELNGEVQVVSFSDYVDDYGHWILPPLPCFLPMNAK